MKPQYFEESRGQSELIGVLLLLAIVLASIGIIGVVAVDGYVNTRSALDEAVIETEFRTIADQAQLVAFEHTDAVYVPFDSWVGDSTGSTVVDEEAGRIIIEVGSDTVFEGPLGAIEYRGDGTRIAYQGGGVFRESSVDRTEIVSKPPIVYANESSPTLIVPLVIVGGDGVASNGLTVTRLEPDRPYPAVIVPANESIAITIESTYYTSWGRFFIEDLPIKSGNVLVDENRESVRMEYAKNEEVFLHLTLYRLEVSGD